MAAWSKALTGVGAAIASVNQGEKGNTADLLKAAATVEREIRLKILT